MNDILIHKHLLMSLTLITISNTRSYTVMVGDGNFLPITYIGSGSLPFTLGMLPLKDVLVFPAIAKSLLFVSKIT